MKLRTFLPLILLGASLPLHADITMPSIFGDHMVLQQEAKIPLWGWADAGEEIAVSIGGKNSKTKADEHGNWHLNLPALMTAGNPQTLTVTGKNTIKFEDVLIGDVWVCSGQSNMGLPVKEAWNGTQEASKANDAQLRIFLVPRRTPADPQKDFAPPVDNNPILGKWQIATPDTVAGFSAAAYYFGREIRRTVGHPVGLIQSSWGGTTIQAWTSIESLKGGFVTEYKKFADGYPAAKASFAAARAAYPQTWQKWHDEVMVPYQAMLTRWQEEEKQAKTAGQPSPSKPQLALAEPPQPKDPDSTPSIPSGLFNGMVNPMVPYAIKGVIWYQGESNDNAPGGYAVLFQNLITDWRSKWAQGDFPFIFVQLPNFAKAPPGSWPVLREGQANALALPHTAMAVTIDIGESASVHPRDKQDVGHRLALAAQAVAYEKNVVYCGPLYDSMAVEGDKIRIKFKNLGGGLVVRNSPWMPGGKPADPSNLTGFCVAGFDKRWIKAKAVIDGDSVVISSGDVPKPIAVRYAWENDPSCNLYNKEELPAPPFRTDNW